MDGRTKLPSEATKDLEEQKRGIWHDDPDCEQRIRNFISQRDIFSNPNYHPDSNRQRSLMNIRKDADGEFVSRTLVGDTSDFEDYKWNL